MARADCGRMTGKPEIDLIRKGLPPTQERINHSARNV